MVRTKNFRRFQEELKKEKIKKRFKLDPQNKDILNNPAEIGKWAHTPCRCSCWMCGNPRHSKCGTQKDALTLQERKSNEDLKNLE